jgi:hypothetical protein
MTRRKRRWAAVLVAAALALAIPGVAWLSLLHQPSFYRARVQRTPEQRKVEARHFVSQSMQLRNDIANESAWEALFTADQVNAWLAEDLVAHFADLVPRGIREPRVSFEPDRVILAFQMDQGPFTTVVWAVLQVDVRPDNVLALTLEKVRAGAIPVPARPYLDRFDRLARAYRIDLKWAEEDGCPVALVAYTPHLNRKDIRLERLQVLDGAIRLTGRSDPRSGPAATFGLPGRKILQASFPTSRLQRVPAGFARSRSRTSSTRPAQPAPTSSATTRSADHS